VGDMVYLKLQPYVQSSLVKRANHKLVFKYFGLFPVEAKVGAVAYKLQLPASSNIHPVFHVSLLKKAIGPHLQVSSNLPLLSENLQIPEKILQRCQVRRPSGDKLQFLIKWAQWPEELATWEDVDSLKLRFPDHEAWGQASSKGGENVRIKKGMAGEGLVAGKTTRLRRPNSRVYGPQWATS
jgi:hypothetical protein